MDTLVLARPSGPRDSARQRCEAAGGQFTEMRARVLDAAISAGGPIRAYELMEAFAREGRPAKPPSVYRAIDFWTGIGVMHRVESLNAFIYCMHDHAPGTAPVFLLCETCGSAEERHADAATASIAKDAAAAGFQVRAMALEVKGLCAACAAAQTEAPALV